MGYFEIGHFFQFLVEWSDTTLELMIEHLVVVAISLSIGVVISLGIGICVWNRSISRRTTITFASIIMTVPSLALLGLLVIPLGLGWITTITALTLYTLLPILQNVVVGLREVSPSVMESAQGMGMSPMKILFVIQLPIAWPVIMSGIRVAAQFTIGVAAVAAYVAGPGLGRYIFDGLNLLGSKNALNLALMGTLGIVFLAILVDGFFVLVNRLTTSKGLHV